MRYIAKTRLFGVPPFGSIPSEHPRHGWRWVEQYRVFVKTRSRFLYMDVRKSAGTPLQSLPLINISAILRQFLRGNNEKTIAALRCRTHRYADKRPVEDTDSAGFTNGNQTVRRIKKIGERHIAKSADRPFAFDGRRRSCEPQNIRANPAACRVFSHGNRLEPKAGIGCNGSVGRNVPM